MIVIPARRSEAGPTREQHGMRAERCGNVCAPRGERVVGLGQDVIHDLVEDLHPGREGLAPHGQVELAREEEGAVARDGQVRLAHERCLADARVTADEKLRTTAAASGHAQRACI